jgi:alpha-L-arabinofuranosidase
MPPRSFRTDSSIKAFLSVLIVALSLPFASIAQSNLIIYSDSLASGWSDQSYNTTRNFANTSPVHSGTHSISATITAAYGGIQLSHSPFTNSAYGFLSFWLNGGSSGGQQLQVYGILGSSVQPGRYYLAAPPVNAWQQYFVPLAALDVQDATNFNGFAIQDSAGGTEPTFYLDDIQLVSSTPPAVTHLTVNASQTIRTADARWFGMNVAIWDSVLDTSTSLAAITNMGLRALRFPGGSASDDYHWLPNQEDTTNNWSWTTSPASFVHLVTNGNEQSMITVNYGTGFTNEAAAWVAYVNAATNSTTPLGTDSLGFNWQTAGYWASLRAAAHLGIDDGKNFLRISRAAPLGFKYWEIGNEVYGGWEMDSNSLPHDPYTYALRARDYISLMKAVDPTIHIGVVSTPGDDSFANYTNHGAVNLHTGQTHYGWTPVLLATLKSLGVTPDFLIHHRYPQNPGGESDEGLLLSSTGWASDAATLRREISDYFGAGGTNIELVCTENNSVSSNPGKQSVSLVAALFMADSLAELMQTELNGLFWWNFQNGGFNLSGNVDSSLYGWRPYGDYGVVESITNFPPYYASKLMRTFVQAGDTVITASSDYILLSTYAVRRQDGSLTILTINKDPTNSATGQVNLAGFVPAANGAVFSYGIPQDNAAEFGVGSPDVAQSALSGAATNFNYSFPPYSATMLALYPAPAKLTATPNPSNATQFIFQLQGQVGAPYVIQRSTNLVSWTSVSTNTLAGSTVNITNPVNASVPKQFWRAVWQP